RRLCDLGVFGYTYRSRESKELFIQWVEQRYGWKIGIEQLSSSPGIVAALPVAIIAFTSARDKILSHTPVYPPFHSIVKENGRELVCSPLKIKEGAYVMTGKILKTNSPVGSRCLFFVTLITLLVKCGVMKSSSEWGSSVANTVF
ncbi:MAG: aminotransferase class I/II-fold pyridoxal phosphate-dependent enzyme, partial [Bacteroidales bacterium]|nr:aminotransferase class I/II-fold pyridoxal phosphate-dependent enzyme [Bacteroidales bacterium]